MKHSTMSPASFFYNVQQKILELFTFSMIENTKFWLEKTHFKPHIVVERNTPQIVRKRLKRLLLAWSECDRKFHPSSLIACLVTFSTMRRTLSCWIVALYWRSVVLKLTHWGKMTSDMRTCHFLSQFPCVLVRLFFNSCNSFLKKWTVLSERGESVSSNCPFLKRENHICDILSVMKSAPTQHNCVVQFRQLCNID